MGQGTITARIGYLFFETVEKERMSALLGKSTEELSALYGVPLASSRDKKLPPILADIKTAEDFLGKYQGRAYGVISDT